MSGGRRIRGGRCRWSRPTGSGCGHPAARGLGLVTAAVGRVIEQAFLPVDQGGLGRRRLELVAARGNLASIKVALSNGFT
ncbi:hypothetical protein GCM10009554_34700 [Kribbella koreensis]|uniref:N-acetyltransferase domain-containing protein n=1 Tax=Kribbella koreensis TaxID=57909 RepID=A0ABP4B013_9ACTN